MSPLPPAVPVRLRARALARLVLLTVIAPAIPLLPVVGARTLMAQERSGSAPPTYVQHPEAAGVRIPGARDTVAPRAALARALGAARRQERSGQAMALAGVVGVVGSSAAWIRAGRMGMSGGQAAIFMGSTSIALAGTARWVAARTHVARARAAQTRADVAGG